MDKKLKWLASFVAVLALGIGSLALAVPDYPHGLRPNRYRCPRPQCTEPCDLTAFPDGYCNDGTNDWPSTKACCCCNENFKDRSFRPPK
jgi:hypothetical protein